MTTCFNKKWNYIIFKLEKILEENKNDKMLKIKIKLFKSIPVEVRDAICAQYIKACRFVHSIAIMEWRQLTITNSEQLQEYVVRLKEILHFRRDENQGIFALNVKKSKYAFK